MGANKGANHGLRGPMPCALQKNPRERLLMPSASVTSLMLVVLEVTVFFSPTNFTYFAALGTLGQVLKGELQTSTPVVHEEGALV